ncbi:MAG: twitching motility protein PilT [archaeon]|nr:twitching motility protein PilT [archaeon]
MPFEIGLNIDAEVRNLLGDVRFVVPGPLVGELKHLAETNRHAKAALALARKREIVPSESHGDDSVLEVALRENAYIVTNDKELRRRARKVRIPLIYLRSGTHLILEKY